VVLAAKPKIKKSFIYRVFPTPHGAKSLLNFDFQKSEFLVVSENRCAGKANSRSNIAKMPRFDILASVQANTA